MSLNYMIFNFEVSIPGKIFMVEIKTYISKDVVLDQRGIVPGVKLVAAGQSVHYLVQFSFDISNVEVETQ